MVTRTQRGRLVMEHTASAHAPASAQGNNGATPSAVAARTTPESEEGVSGPQSAPFLRYYHEYHAEQAQRGPKGRR